MKKFVIAGTLMTALAVGASAFAQAPAEKQPAAKKPAAAAGDQAAAEKPAVKKTVKHAAASENPAHTAPLSQPNTTGEPSAPGPMDLGSVHLPKGVKLDGKAIDAGTYKVRLTADEAKPDAKGSTEKLERWVEFMKGTTVVGKEVVSIVPAGETKLVQKDAPPPNNGSKVQTLKGGDYVRVWINKGGNYYLVHLPNS